MSDDQLFRLILIAGMVAVIPFAVYFRFKSFTDEKLDRRQEGIFILIPLRLLGIVGMLGLLAFVFNPEWIAWSSMPLPTWARWIGVGIGVCCGALLIWTMKTLGKNLTDTVVTRRDATMVTGGPYRWVRHPFYVAFALAVVANTLVTANWFVLAFGVPAFCLIVARTRIEERHLIAKFGDEYRQYIERTGRFWPRLGARQR